VHFALSNSPPATGSNLPGSCRQEAKADLDRWIDLPISFLYVLCYGYATSILHGFEVPPVTGQAKKEIHTEAEPDNLETETQDVQSGTHPAQHTWEGKERKGKERKGKECMYFFVKLRRERSGPPGTPKTEMKKKRNITYSTRKSTEDSVSRKKHKSSQSIHLLSSSLHSHERRSLDGVPERKSPTPTGKGRPGMLSEFPHSPFSLYNP